MPKLKEHLIYVRNINCDKCGQQKLYYLHVKKLICDCGDVEVNISNEVLKEHFKSFDRVLRELTQERKEQ